MKKKVILIEGRNSEGKIILSLEISEDEVTVKEVPDISVAEEEEKKEKKEHTDIPQNDNPMTAAQKRYLFRILAERGLEKDTAHEHLKELFRVDSLTEVTKIEASNLIERLLGEKKEGSNGPPF
jgi:hypothetical protein